MVSARGFRILEGIRIDHGFTLETFLKIIFNEKKMLWVLGNEDHKYLTLTGTVGASTFSLYLPMICVGRTMAVTPFSEARCQQVWTLEGLAQRAAKGGRQCGQHKSHTSLRNF